MKADLPGRVKSELKCIIGVSLMLDAVGIVIVVLVRLALGPAAFSKYLRTVSCHALSMRDGICLLLSVAVLATAYELICRIIIQRGALLAGKLRWLGVSICAGLLGLLVLYFGPGPGIEGVALGAAAAIVYGRFKSRWSMVLWHVQWAWLGVLATVVLAVFFEGEARYQYLWAYKQKNIMDGTLYYREGWGWVDNSHYHDKRLTMLLEKMDAAKTNEPLKITINEPFVTVIRRWLPVERIYLIPEPPGPNPIDRWALACSISLDFSKQNEEAQSTVPSWLCSDMSAWQFDDLASTLLTCLDRAPDAEEAGRQIRGIPELLKRWEAEGDGLVRGAYREVRLPENASARQRQQLKRIQESRKLWRFVGVGDGDFTRQK